MLVNVKVIHQKQTALITSFSFFQLLVLYDISESGYPKYGHFRYIAPPTLYLQGAANQNKVNRLVSSNAFLLLLSVFYKAGLRRDGRVLKLVVSDRRPRIRFISSISSSNFE